MNTLRRHLPSLERLRALSEVARLGGFTAAAKALGLTQPAISNHVRLLEQQLGLKLLERIGKTARPTREGETLIAASARAFGEIARAMDEIAHASASISGPLVLATGPTATTYLLPPVMADLRRRHPGIDLRVITGNTLDMIPGLLDGSVDLGLLTAPVRDRHLRSRFFFRDRLVCITPPGEAPTAKAIRPRDLEGRQLFLYDRGGSIRRAVDAWLDAADPKRVRIGDIGSAEALTASIVSEVTARDAAAAGRIDLNLLSPSLFRDLVLVWRADRATRPVIAAALDVFSSHAHSLRSADLQVRSSS
jgi:DNA-binding transcriptional LysR family regulator